LLTRAITKSVFGSLCRSFSFPLAQTDVGGSPDQAKKQAGDRRSVGEEAQKKVRLDDIDDHQQGDEKTKQDQQEADDDDFPGL
jgi:hypothetical protein